VNRVLPDIAEIEWNMVNSAGWFYTGCRAGNGNDSPGLKRINMLAEQIDRSMNIQHDIGTRFSMICLQH